MRIPLGAGEQSAKSQFVTAVLGSAKGQGGGFSEVTPFRLPTLHRTRSEFPNDECDPAPIWRDTQAVADWALMNSLGERILSPE